MTEDRVRAPAESAEPRWDVLGCGLVSVDELLYVDHYPPPDTKAQVMARDRQGGGLTGTALVAAARVGARCAFGGVLGYDDLSEHAISELVREGIDVSLMIRRPDARPCHSVIIVDRTTGSRNIFYTREGVMTRMPEDITPELVTSCRVLFVDHLNLDAALRMARLANEHGVPVVSDIEFGAYAAAEELLTYVQHLIAAESFALSYTGARDPEASVAILAQQARRCTAVTAGERGLWYSIDGGPVQHLPAFRVQVVDTTGCGDVFHGAYAACIARGLEPAASLRFASATSAIKATCPGGRAGIPTREAVERFLAERGG